jgi:hypothetical protein
MPGHVRCTDGMVRLWRCYCRQITCLVAQSQFLNIVQTTAKRGMVQVLQQPNPAVTASCWHLIIRSTYRDGNGHVAAVTSLSGCFVVCVE